VSRTTDTRDYFEKNLGGSMVAVKAAGDSLVMSDAFFGNEVPQQLRDNFTISRMEVTRAQYAYFIDTGGYDDTAYWTDSGWAWRESGEVSRPSHWDAYTIPDQPVVGVSWYEAVAFCNWLSARAGLPAAYDEQGRLIPGAHGYHLPTELQWEYVAARAGAPLGVEREFPYGDGWDPNLVVCAQKGPLSVGSRPLGNTPLGIADLAGNAWEWCSDTYGAIETPASDEQWYRFDASTDYFLVRGGHWGGTYEYSFRSAARATYEAETRSRYIGFRLVRSR
jgi:formylglycine-generating enzyme required for sulfatase activity